MANDASSAFTRCPNRKTKLSYSSFRHSSAQSMEPATHPERRKRNRATRNSVLLVAASISAFFAGCVTNPVTRPGKLSITQKDIDELYFGGPERKGLPRVSGTAFFECSRCGTFHCYTPNGYQGLIPPAAKFCKHDWIRIYSKREFKRRIDRRWPGQSEFLCRPFGLYWNTPDKTQGPSK